MFKRAAILSLKVLNRAAVMSFRATGHICKARDWLRNIVESEISVPMDLEADSQEDAQHKLAQLQRAPGFVSADIEESEGKWMIRAWINPQQTPKA